MRYGVVKKYGIMLIIGMILVSITNYSLAKYYQSYENNSLYEAENFYFDSDLLKSSLVTYNYKKGIDYITINLSNNIDSLRYTKVDTDYKVSIKNISGTEVISKGGNIISDITGKISGNSINNKEITFSNLPTGTYRVKAESIKPYVKSLEAIFVIENDDNSIIYSVSDSAGSTVLYLTITCEEYNGDISITIPDNVNPDNNDPNFDNVNISSSKIITVNFNHNSEYSFKFFKNNPNSVYTKNDFNVVAK